MFVDELELLVRGGRGGNGAVSFRREKYVPHGGPDGGDGGDGGNVYLYADSSKHSFLDLRYLHTLKAADGAHGRGRDQHGARGADLLVPVPLGTIVRDDKQRVLADLTSAGQKAKVAAGGKGGRGNARFASSRKRVPRVAEKGLPGVERILKLELKLIAQVGLVGFPNAGKSTLLGRISSAKPKVAAYPFTTLVPNLGVVKVGNEGSFVVADLPGLIEGAHQGAGLGHQFLRHVERNLLLLFLIDLSPDAHPAPTDAYRLLKDELNIFSSLLANYPRVIVGNKIDLPGAAENMDIFRRIIAEEEGEGIPLFAISAVTGEGVDTLVYDLFRRVNELAAESGRTRNEEVTLIGEENITEKLLTIEKKGEIFMVSGDAIERMAAKTDFENEEALKRFQHFCSRIGLDKKLKKAGISEGDTVRVGEEEFYFYE
ncbi:MAG: GTPase ObgE [Bacillota bacterium]|nr:GTPase ObgE [Bacillota bacterium]